MKNIYKKSIEEIKLKLNWDITRVYFFGYILQRIENTAIFQDE